MLAVHLSQHEITVAGDVGARVHREQADGDVTPASVAAAMRAAMEVKIGKLKIKLGKLLAISNPELTDGWLQEVMDCRLSIASLFKKIFVPTFQHLIYVFVVH